MPLCDSEKELIKALIEEKITQTENDISVCVLKSSLPSTSYNDQTLYDTLAKNNKELIKRLRTIKDNI